MPNGVHMHDLYARRESFAGKDRAQASHAADAFVGLLAGLHDWVYRRYSCVMNVKDYATAQASCPSLSEKALHAFCVDHCVGRIFSPRFREEHDSEANIEILFDGNEVFFEHLHTVWEAEKNESWSWARYVLSVREVSNAGNRLLPMQAADALAWVARRYRARSDHREWFDALCGQKRTQTNCHDYFDYDELMAT